MAEHKLSCAQRTGDVPVKLFEVTPSPISADDVIARLADPAVGAIAAFVGVVRGETEGRETLYLEYEAYPDMAEATLAQIGDETQDRWPSIRQVAIAHRVGRLEIGETATVIAVSAAHRSDVFAALHFCIDRLKEIVPIWKKEVWADGEAWKSERKDTKQDFTK
ncbi:MAG: molybdenum cofactor biosynthesis protein MoaE [Anaerolineae bacterium]|nr:molybdenum cofactor biosynthesis protein MoaE [Anaerolineae bacterium]